MKSKISTVFIFFFLAVSLSYAQPSWIQPLDNAKYVTINKTLSWQQYGIPFLNYSVEVYKKDAPKTLVASQYNGGSSFGPLNLQYNTTYTWFVKNDLSIWYPNCILGIPLKAKWPDGYDFTTILAQPQLASPNNCAIQQSTTATVLSWAMQGKTSNVVYELRYGTDPLLNTFTSIPGLVGTSRLLPTLINNTTYYWQVIAKVTSGPNVNETKASLIRRFTTVLAKPVNSIPVDGALSIGTSTPLLVKWTMNGNISNVNFTVEYTVDDWGSIMATPFVHAATQIFIPGLQQGRKYDWRVVAVVNDGSVDNNNESRLSNPTTFYTQSNIYSEPTIITPVNGAKGQLITGLLFTWDNFDPSTTKYGFRLFKVTFNPTGPPTFTLIHENLAIAPGSNPTVVYNPGVTLEANSKYDWFIYSDNSNPDPSHQKWNPSLSHTGYVFYTYRQPTTVSPVINAVDQDYIGLHFTWDNFDPTTTNYGFRLFKVTAGPTYTLIHENLAIAPGSDATVDYVPGIILEKGTHYDWFIYSDYSNPDIAHDKWNPSLFHPGYKFTTYAYPKPYAITPVNGAVGQAAVGLHFTWDNFDPSTSNYGFQLFKVTAGPTYTLIHENLAIVPGINPIVDYDPGVTLEANTQYDWFIRSDNSNPDAAHQKWNPTFNHPGYVFKTYVQPTTISPVNNGVGYATTGLHFTWDNFDPSTTKYGFQLFKVTAGPTYTLIHENLLIAPGTNPTVDYDPGVTLELNTQYDWFIYSDHSNPVASNQKWNPSFNHPGYLFKTYVLPTTIIPPNLASGQVTAGLTFTWDNFDPTTANYGFRLFKKTSGPTYTLIHEDLAIAPGTNPNVVYAPGLTLDLNATYEWFIYSDHSQSDAAHQKWNPLFDHPGYIFNTYPQLTLLSPADNAIGQPILPTFEWSTVYGTVKYGLVISDGFSVVYNILVTPSTSPQTYTLTSAQPLEYNRTYLWQVKSFDGTSWSIAPAPFNFTTEVATPNITGPSGGGVTVNNPVVTWLPLAPNAMNVILFVDYRLNDGPGPWITSAALPVTDVSYALPILDYNTKYDVRVRAVVTTGPNTGEERSSSVLTFTTEELPPPYLTAPINTSTGVSIQPLFSWNWTGFVGPTPVTFDLFVTDILTMTIQVVYGITSPYQSLETQLFLSNNKVYSWKVRANQGSNFTDSSPFTFMTSPPAKAIHSNPANGTTTYAYSPVFFGWYLMVGTGNLTFKVQYLKQGDIYPHSTPDASNWFFHATTVPTVDPGDLYLNTEMLAAGTKYWWRVITYRGTDIISYSTPTNFKTSGGAASAKAILTYPKDDVDVYTLTPTFYWFTTSGDLSDITFDLLIDENGDFGPTDITITGITNLNYALSGVPPQRLLPGRQYRWKVITHYDFGTVHTTEESTVASFITVGGHDRGLPLASWPVGTPAPTVFTLTPKLYWYMQGSTLGLTNFRVAWVESPGSLPANPNDWSNLSLVTGYAIVPVSQNSLTIAPPLLYGKTYTWGIVSYDGISYSAVSTGAFTIVGTTTSIVPIIAYPTNGAIIYSTSATLTWYVNGPTMGIDHYVVMYGTTSNFSNATTVDPVYNQYLNITDLLPGANYYWKVAAHNGNALSDFSATGTFFTVNIGAYAIVPTIGNPNGIPITTTSPMFSWTLPSIPQLPLAYELQYSTKQDMSNATTVPGIKIPYQIINGLQKNQVYYWRVRSYAKEGEYSSYSAIGRFTIPGDGSTTTSVEDNGIVPTEFVLDQNYPNPFNPTTKITYTLPQGSVVTIRIYDMLGREVKTLVSKEMNAGKHSIDWNADDNLGDKVSSGTYIYRISAGNFVATKKMVLIK